MALELYKPFLMRELVKREIASNIKIAKKMVEEEEILQIIDDLKESMPAELEQSKKILAERDKVIADAQHHAGR